MLVAYISVGSTYFFWGGGGGEHNYGLYLASMYTGTFSNL